MFFKGGGGGRASFGCSFGLAKFKLEEGEVNKDIFGRGGKEAGVREDVVREGDGLNEPCVSDEFGGGGVGVSP